MSREPNCPRGLFHDDHDDGVTHARCPDCGVDTGVVDCGDGCSFRALDDVEIETAGSYPLNDDGDEVEHTERCWRCGLDCEIGAHEDGCPTEGEDDSATVRMISEIRAARQKLTGLPRRLGTEHMGSATGGGVR